MGTWDRLVRLTRRHINIVGLAFAALVLLILIIALGPGGDAGPGLIEGDTGTHGEGPSGDLAWGGDPTPDGSGDTEGSAGLGTPSPTSAPKAPTPAPTESGGPTQAAGGKLLDSPAGTIAYFTKPVYTHRPIAVMIDNEGPGCLPQGGIYQAQFVYEMVVEYGETRLMGVYWDADSDLVGNVRSSRHYFIDYVIEHDAIYIHIGWSPMAQADITNYKVSNINGVLNSAGIFWKITGEPGNWQDSYTSFAKIGEGVAQYRYRTDSNNKPVFGYVDPIYDSLDPMDIYGPVRQPVVDLRKTNGLAKAAFDEVAFDAAGVSITYSTAYGCSYEYDAETGLYLRYRNGERHMDRVPGMQLTARNIIVSIVPNAGIPGDREGRQTLSNVGQGKGWLVAGGKAVEIEWRKDSRTHNTVYSYPSGEAIALNEGQTWIQLVPSASSVTFG
ncbi:MAG: DUF3048 domain-containing protein [Oscillospiraceae bacterium]|nr:DUF3048 domain-containing protein [Oscillospiraceae bacterium]